MRFTLTIECDNAAFEPDEDGGTVGGPEIARILVVASRQLGGRFEIGTEGGCYDTNGNRVGQWEITAD